MKVLFLILAGCFLAAAQDSIAMESGANYQKVEARVGEEDAEEIPERKYYLKNGERRRNLIQREREARGIVYELSPGYEIEGKYQEEPKQRYYPEHVIRREYQHESPSSAEDRGEHIIHSGSYLSHIKEQMNDGKLLGYSSFVEHFSENDDAEELKTAMREGSLDDIKKLVPKSTVSFQMFHGEEEPRQVKVEPVPEKKHEVSWNEINAWHQPKQWTQPQTHLVEKRKKIRKHPIRKQPYYHFEEPKEEVKATPVTEKVNSIVYEEENYPQIVQAQGYELPTQDYKVANEFEQERQESQNHQNQEWRPVEKPTVSASELYKVLNTPKPPETSMLYYEHFKNSKTEEPQVKITQVPKVGRIIVDQPAKPKLETNLYFKKPLRIKSTPQPFKKPVPNLASGEDFNQRFAQLPNITPQPIRYWSKPELKQRPVPVPTPVKLEKILNKQIENQQIESPKENGNIFLTKEFQNEVSDYFKGGKSDFEWVPSTQIRYEESNPRVNYAKPENTERKPKKYRIYRSNQPNPKNVVILGPESGRNRGEFAVSASYKIDKNRKSDAEERR